MIGAGHLWLILMVLRAWERMDCTAGCWTLPHASSSIPRKYNCHLPLLGGNTRAYHSPLFLLLNFMQSLFTCCNWLWFGDFLMFEKKSCKRVMVEETRWVPFWWEKVPFKVPSRVPFHMFNLNQDCFIVNVWRLFERWSPTACNRCPLYYFHPCPSTILSLAVRIAGQFRAKSQMSPH